MEMHQIRYFLTLCEELNFTRAAEKCHVAQPALTRAIKLLEEEFGGLLFHRERAQTISASWDKRCGPISRRFSGSRNRPRTSRRA